MTTDTPSPTDADRELADCHDLDWRMNERDKVICRTLLALDAETRLPAINALCDIHREYAAERSAAAAKLDEAVCTFDDEQAAHADTLRLWKEAASRVHDAHNTIAALESQLAEATARAERAERSLSRLEEEYESPQGPLACTYRALEEAQKERDRLAALIETGKGGSLVWTKQCPPKGTFAVICVPPLNDDMRMICKRAWCSFDPTQWSEGDDVLYLTLPPIPTEPTAQPPSGEKLPDAPLP